MKDISNYISSFKIKFHSWLCVVTDYIQLKLVTQKSSKLNGFNMKSRLLAIQNISNNLAFFNYEENEKYL